MNLSFGLTFSHVFPVTIVFPLEANFESLWHFVSLLEDPRLIDGVVWPEFFWNYSFSVFHSFHTRDSRILNQFNMLMVSPCYSFSKGRLMKGPSQS